MIVYLKYFVTWLFFMVLIAGITLIVPKLAKKIDKWRAEKKAQMEKQEQPVSEPESKPESAPEPDGKNE